jgi:hypothetical protein
MLEAHMAEVRMDTRSIIRSGSIEARAVAVEAPAVVLLVILIRVANGLNI